jgi:hypothetical protein
MKVQTMVTVYGITGPQLPSDYAGAERIFRYSSVRRADIQLNQT